MNPKISSGDSDLVDGLKILAELSTTFITHFMQLDQGKTQTIEKDAAEKVDKFNEVMNELKEDLYNIAFGVQSSVEREVFITHMSGSQYKYLHPKALREMVNLRMR